MAVHPIDRSPFEDDDIVPPSPIAGAHAAPPPVTPPSSVAAPPKPAAAPSPRAEVAPVRDATPEPTTARTVICPYCGAATPLAPSCTSCGGRFDPLTRQTTQNAMGPWFIRDDASPHRPGCSYDVLAAMVRRGRVGPEAVVRGPTTNQFWCLARRTPGLAHLLGVCHNCDRAVLPSDTRCPSCRAPFALVDDRQHLGLLPVRLLPGQAPPAEVANGRPSGSPPRPNPPPLGPDGRPIAASAPSTTPSVAASPGMSSADEAEPPHPRFALRRRPPGPNAWLIASLACLVVLPVGAVIGWVLRTPGTPGSAPAPTPPPAPAEPIVERPPEPVSAEAPPAAAPPERVETPPPPAAPPAGPDPRQQLVDGVLAAIQSGDPAAIRDALQRLRDSGFGGPEIDALIAQLEQILRVYELQGFP